MGAAPLLLLLFCGSEHGRVLCSQGRIRQCCMLTLIMEDPADQVLAETGEDQNLKVAEYPLEASDVESKRDFRATAACASLAASNYRARRQRLWLL